jgi:hypothetical protein
LAWSPNPQSGLVRVSIDGKTAQEFAVDGGEKMGNGSGVVTKGAAYRILPIESLPASTLTVSDLFPDQRLEFSFTDLPEGARQRLLACFAH